MSRILQFGALALAGLLVAATESQAQTAYIGYVYPAGGQQGTTVQIRLGAQRLIRVDGAVVSGEGVTAKVVDYYRRLGNQEVSLMREQQRILRRDAAAQKKAGEDVDRAAQKMIDRIQERVDQWVNRPAVAAHSELVFLEVAIAPDAEPGRREIRLITERGVTNPLPFYVGQVPEVARKAMKTCLFQVLGKEYLAKRKRPPEEEEVQITVPSTMNGQIASGEVNKYRFEATKGQRLVISTLARQLIPYIADAVPGWFQPVLVLRDADGNEVAYNDDFRFKPDPTLYYEVPEDGEYVLSITDAIYRGREDFVYRLTIGEVPFVTGIFPLGGRAGEKVSIEMDGWNLEGAKLKPPPQDAPPGVHQIAARKGGFVSNRVPFALDTLPECFDQESNDDPAHAQEVELPVIINGRTDRPDDWDVFAFAGRAGDKIVAEVHARRLDSPMDSMLRITDAEGNLLGLNDDCMDVGSGLNTHHADSYLTVELPSDGTYFVHLGDTARAGGPEYAYRLRLSAPRPDFELRVVPSGGGLRAKSAVSPTVYAIRKDGFDGPIKLGLKDPPEGFTSPGVTLPAGKELVRFGVRTTLTATDEPVKLVIEGRATIGDREVAHDAVPADDQMQAFLWRHLVPAQESLALVYNPSRQPPPERVAPELTEELKAKYAPKDPALKAKFNKRQVQGRIRQLKTLYEDGFLTDDFYLRKIAECEAAL